MDSRPKTQDQRPKTQDARHKTGSAIILAIVLTSLLAIIGVLFLISSRVDSIATSSIADNKDLTFAVDTVIANISEDLVNDVSKGSIDPNFYADYPDASNYWLACLEPYSDLGIYKWRQVSNIYGPGAVQNVQAQILPDYNTAMVPYTEADADGDGVSDSMWVLIHDVNSSKGKPIYAAVRIIDNGGMLNVNTGLIFDPGSSIGLSQKDINVAALSQRGANGIPVIAATKLDDWRRGIELSNLYEPNVIWQYENPKGAFTPFDISDELVLRNRYILNSDKMTTRIENLWTYAFKGGLEDPRTDASLFQSNPDYWYARVDNISSDPCIYDYQHIATTYNCDRIIRPDGQKMVNINTADPITIRNAILQGLVDANAPGDVNGTAAQIAANVIDYRDDDNDVTAVSDYSGNLHFGFERPCIYISEIAQNFYQSDASNSSTLAKSYAIELFKPYPEDVLPDSNWQLVIIDTSGTNRTISVNWSGSNAFHVFLDDATNLINPSSINFTDINGTVTSGAVQTATGSLSFDSNYEIDLRRHVNDPCSSGYDITVDKVIVPPAGADWLQIQINPATPATYSFQRDISTHKPIRRLWDLGLSKISLPSLGGLNSYTDTNDTRIIQAHPANKSFTNVGEIGQLFYNTTYDYGGSITPGITEPEMRINLADPNFQQIFKYLTVMDPCDHGATVANESRIKGRININTAPWFVIAQLPWISYQNYDIARAIVDKRESRGGYKSIGELMADANGSADNIGYYESKFFTDIPPVLMTPKDFFSNEDVFEKRDLIFARISNLVTVRSDVFTAYILVRIGPNGPQKRVIAILDRSEVPAKPVKVIAIQSVPDPR